MKVYVIIVLGLFLLGIDNTVGDIKSSLTFVIDNTASMGDDIHMVKKGANDIFDTVMRSNSSQIEDFVLVTFNDPDSWNELRVRTKDRSIFINALNSITLHSRQNVDCAEMSMSGIKMGLQNSREGSYIYVFTDAAAKDHGNYDEVEALSHKMGCQIVFVLTGICGSKTDEDYMVFEDLAVATNGQVYHLEKDEIGEILNEIEINIQSRMTVLTSKTFPAGYRNKFEIDVDAGMKELLIYVSGLRPSAKVTNPEGKDCPPEVITRLLNNVVVKVESITPGKYTVEVGSAEKTRVTVKGDTTVHFQHGFSTVSPTSINDTVKRPVPGVKSHLSIKLSSEGGNVQLRSVQILDMDDEVILETPLELVDEPEQFYTTELIKPPDHMFNVAIIGYDVNTDTLLKRVSLTPIKPQDSKPASVKTKAPVVDCKPEVTATYGKSLQLKCRVSGYPRPDVIWQSDDKSVDFSHFESTIELPYDYISVLDIKDVKKNTTYTCKAVNPAGNGENSINISVKVPPKAPVVECTPMVTTEYNQSLQIQCNVSGYPRPHVTWESYDKSTVFSHVESTMKLPYDYITVLDINNVKKPSTYTCKVVNSAGHAKNSVRVKMINTFFNVTASPKDTTIRYHESFKIPCKVDAIPPATVSWFRNLRPLIPDRNMEVSADGSLMIRSMEPSMAGNYVCEAENGVQRKISNFRLDISGWEAPEINKNNRQITVAKNSEVDIRCQVTKGMPYPEIEWYYHDDIKEPKRLDVTKDTIHFDKVDVANAGSYRCIADNEGGMDFHDINLIVDDGFEPKFEYPDDLKDIQFVAGETATMDCTAIGVPTPKVKWYHNGMEISHKEYKYDLYMNNDYDKGRYTCVVSNSFGTVQQEFAVSSFECLLDNHFDKNEPIMLTTYNEVPSFETSGGLIRIPKGETIKFICPSRFRKISAREITVTCENEQQFLHPLSGRLYSYSDLKCKNTQPGVKRTGLPCTHRNSEILNVGFETSGTFQTVYEVCFDWDSNNPIYTKLDMQPPLANVVASNDTEWFDYGSHVDLDGLYDCSNQNAKTSVILNKEFHRDDGCCFAKRTLVNPLDVAPGLQGATYTNLNVAPHWGTCNSKNWEEVERLIRRLVVSLDRTLQVFTGTAYNLQLPNAYWRQRNVVLHSRGKHVQVPKYFWKVVQDPATEASLVIVQVNVPDLSINAAHIHQLCTDVCRDAKWMQPSRGRSRWRNVNHGFTYCCSLSEFERVFRYHGVFPNYHNLIKI